MNIYYYVFGWVFKTSAFLISDIFYRMFQNTENDSYTGTLVISDTELFLIP